MIDIYLQYRGGGCCWWVYPAAVFLCLQGVNVFPLLLRYMFFTNLLLTFAGCYGIIYDVVADHKIYMP